VSQQLLFSSAATLQMLAHRMHFMRQYEADQDNRSTRTTAAAGEGDKGVVGAVMRDRTHEEVTRDQAECEGSMRLLSHQLSMQADDRQTRYEFPSPLESCALILLYTVRFCPSVTAATSSMLPSSLPSSSALYPLLLHCRRWLLSCSDYALLLSSEQTRLEAMAMGTGNEESSQLDVSAMLRLCWTMAERVPRDVQWENLRSFVHA